MQEATRHARRRIVSVLFVFAVLGACSNPEREQEAGSNTMFGPVAAQTEDKFGQGFGKAFRADPNSEPAEVADSDVRPVSLTDEPVEIN